MDAVLLFDEADALFGKRTDIKDAHDRFANTDTNYLLQAIEAYRGIAILATNKKGNIDPAFTRRLRYVLEFPRPDTAQRRTLWERLVGELAGAERLRELGYAIDPRAGTAGRWPATSRPRRSAAPPGVVARPRQSPAELARPGPGSCMRGQGR